MFIPKHSHEFTFNTIGQYLKETRDRGLVLNPSTELKTDLYPDTYFSITYGNYKATDLSCVKSITGYAINVADCPVLWKFRSKPKKIFQILR